MVHAPFVNHKQRYFNSRMPTTFFYIMTNEFTK